MRILWPYLVITAFFSMVLNNTLQAGRVDSTIFSSATEKKLFMSYLDSVQTDALELLLSFKNSPAESDKIKLEIANITADLRARGIESKSKKKQISLIYKTIHASQLKKYNEKAFFNDIFTSGEYNCVTASALYALIFDKFGINYQIKETPTHVYLIAEPETDRVMIETTLPAKGVTFFDERFKREFVMYLLKNKLISQEEFDRKSIEQLFKENYDKNQTINIYQLAGVQYYNKGIFLFEETKYYEAATNFEKACLLHPQNSFKFSYTAALANVLNDQVIKKNYQGKTLSKYLNLNNKNAEALVYGEEFFNTVSNEWVVNKPNLVKYKEYFAEFSDFLADSIDLDSYNQTYYKMLGYHDFSKGNFAGALRQLGFAYLSNPLNIEIQELIENVGIRYLFTDRKHEAAIDSLEYYFELFPFLTEKQNYQQYYTYCYMRTIQLYFQKGNAKKGDELLLRFEQIMNNDKPAFNEEMLEAFYTELSSIYVRMQNYSMANEMINRGLVYVPGSEELKFQRENIKQYKNLSSAAGLNQVNVYQPTEAEVLLDSFDKYFTGKWKCVAVEADGKRREAGKNESIEIIISQGRKVNYTVKNIKQTGKWSLRGKSKLLYLVPERNKEDYLMFQVIEINPTLIKLKLFENNRFSSTVYVLEKCG